jgi:hypothetical protein
VVAIPPGECGAHLLEWTDDPPRLRGASHDPHPLRISALALAPLAQVKAIHEKHPAALLAEAVLGLRGVRGHRHLLIRPEAVLGVRAGDSGRLRVRMVGGAELEVSRGAAPGLKTRLGLG